MRRAAFGLAVFVVLVTAWMARYEVVHVRQRDYVVLDRFTGTLRYCENMACYPVANEKPDLPAKAPYEDLIPKK